MARSHMRMLARTLVQGVRANATASGAMLDIDGEAVDRLEGVARAFLPAALLVVESGGADQHVAQWMRDVVAVGVSAEHPDRWPRQGDHGQVTVEATLIAVSLHLTRAWVFERLDADTRARLLDWLEADHWCADNNHVLFGAVCQAFRLRAGEPVDASPIWAALDRIDEWYLGDGWYTDGDGRRIDHYNAFAFHLYPFWLLDLLDPEGARTVVRREEYRRRLRHFVQAYQHLFGDDGCPVAMGRSLTYRFGVLAPFWMAELEGCSPLPPGEVASLTARCLEYFLSHGAMEDELLTLGWHGPSASVLQPYNKPGSPLWATKGLLGLLLPADHPAWSAGEAHGRVGDAATTHPTPGFLTWKHLDDGITRLINVGSDGHPCEDDPLYRRSAYSSATMPCTTPGWRDQSIAPLGGLHRGRDAGVARPDSAADRVRWAALGRECVIDHAMLVLEGAELHIARCQDVVAMPITVGGWHAPTGLPSALQLIATDAQRVVRERLDDGSAVGPSSLERLVLSPSGNELHVMWATGLGAAAPAVENLVGGVDVTWRDGGADVVLPDGTRRPLAFVTGRRRWVPETAAQRVYRWL